MATRTWRGTTNANWGTATNWLEGAVPLVTDDVVFDASSPACTIDTTARVAKTIDFTSYTDTITFSVNLTVSGNITLGSAMSMTGAASLLMNTTGTIRSNGKTFDIPFIVTLNNIVVTVFDDWTFNSVLNVGNGGNISATFNGNNFYCKTNLIMNGSTILGTTQIVMNGTGTLTGASTGGFKCPIIINTTGTITLSASIALSTGAVFTYTAGTVNVSTNTLYLLGACTIYSSGMTWRAVSSSSTSVNLTLGNDMIVQSSCSFGGNGGTINGFNLYIGGTLAANSTSTGALGGTTNIIMNGTGPMNFLNLTTGSVRWNIEVNTTGTVTLASNIRYMTGTFKLTAGAFVHSGNFTTVGACTIQVNGPGFKMDNIVLAAATAFAGSYDLEIDTLSSVTVGLTHTFTPGLNLIIDEGTTLTATAASNIILSSSVASTPAKITIKQGAYVDFSFVRGIDIDSSDGLTVWTFKGSLLRTTNWKLLVPPSSSAFTF